MFLGIRRKYWLYLNAAVLLAGLVLFLNLSPVFAWKRCNAHGPLSNKVEPVFADNITQNQNIFQIDIKNILATGLAKKEIEKIGVRLTLPDGITAEVNRFEPVALVAGGNENLMGIGCHCRLIPFDSEWADIDLPILSGLKLAGLFETPHDFRVAKVVKALNEIKKEAPKLYGQLAEIDFSDQVYLTLYLTSSKKRFRVMSNGLAGQILKLAAVGGVDDWSEGGCYNLIYDGLVIREE